MASKQHILYLVFAFKNLSMKISQTILIVFIVSCAGLLLAQQKPENVSVDLTKQVKLYPNPAIEFLTVRFETPQARKAKLALHNIIGSELETESELIDDFEVRIKVKDLSTGFYLLLIKNEETGLKGAYKFLKK